MKFQKFTIRDIVFIAIMAALLLVCSAVSMPLMSTTLFGLKNMATAIFYGLFGTLTIMKVRKPGTMTLLGVLNAAVLAMMSPIMFLTNAVSALLAELVALLLFKSYENPKAIVASACLMIPFSLPFTAVFTVVLNDVSFAQVLSGSWLALLCCIGTVVLSFLGGFLGRKIGAELQKAGKLS